MKYLIDFLKWLYTRLMDQGQYIKSRNKLQFASPLAFAKIVDKGTISGSVGASTSATLSRGHTLSVPPKVIGWARMDGSGNWLPLTDPQEYLSDKLGYRLGIYQYSKAAEFGFHLKNLHASGHSVEINYWLYIV